MMRGDDDLDKNPEKSTSWQGFKFFCGDSGEELNQNSTLSNYLESDDIIFLSQVQAGEIILVVDILPIDCIEELKNMGLLPGKEIQVISRTTTGSVIVIADNQRIGLGKDMARNIKVRRINLDMS
ncbi:MAG: ferrous iron transport protein A [Cyanobacteria bacterium J06629_18]